MMHIPAAAGCTVPAVCTSCTSAAVALAAASLVVAAMQATRLFLLNIPGTGVAAKAAATLASSGSFTERVANTVSAAATGSGALWWLLPLSGLLCCWRGVAVLQGLQGPEAVGAGQCVLPRL